MCIRDRFEPIHGSYPEAAGKDIANPIATILSAAMLLDSFEMFDESKLVRNIVKKVIERGLVTPDLNPDSFIACSKVGDVISLLIESDLEDESAFDNLFQGNLPLI